jgi:hypothetical protein
MKGGGLRILVGGLGAALVAGGGLYWIAGCGPAIALRVAVPGLILIGAVAFERWRYQRLASRAPGRGFLATAERFVDPETGRPVTVYHNPETGERRYVGAAECREASPRRWAG